MSNVTLNVKTDSVPSGFCFQNWPTSWPELVQLLSVTFPMANGGIHIGETPPAAQYQTWPWLKINATTHKPERIYYFNQGDWVSPYPIPSSTYFVSMWTGDAASIPLIDGGTTDTITDRTGAFWEINTNMSGFMPIGVGNIGGSSGTTAITVGTTGGEENHALTLAECFDHDHVYGMRVSANNDVYLTYKGVTGFPNGGTNDTFKVEGEGATASTASYASGDLLTMGMHGLGIESTAHNNMPPYYPVYYIKRTARIYYTAT